MNSNHEFCGSDLWREMVRDEIIPWALGDGELGDDLLEVGPGYGATTDVFRERVAALTAVEIDPAGLDTRLVSAGFADVTIDINEYGWSARAHARNG